MFRLTNTCCAVSFIKTKISQEKTHVSSSLGEWFLGYKEILETETITGVYIQVANSDYSLKRNVLSCFQSHVTGAELSLH